jgi:hypothetical protein
MRRRLLTTRLALALACALALCACDDNATPSTPTQQITVTGRWTGDLTVQGVTGQTVWTLTQSGTSVTGPVTIGLPNGVIFVNGSLTGTLAGSMLTYTIAVGPSGVPTQPTCTGQFSGTMTVSIGTVSTMSGRIALMSSSCAIQFPATSVTLTRQSGLGM